MAIISSAAEAPDSPSILQAVMGGGLTQEVK